MAVKSITDHGTPAYVFPYMQFQIMGYLVKMMIHQKENG